jgi:hypothetical protein
MQVCTKCDGDGSRTVELSNGEKIKKGCYVCGGQGFLPGTPAIAVMVPPKLKQVPAENPKERKLSPVMAVRPTSLLPKFEPNKRGLLSSPLGDLSWLGTKRLTHG